MIKIYGVLRSRTLRNVWFCEEAGLPYEHVPVIQAFRLKDPHAPDAPFNTRSPDFLKLNPAALIPVMTDGDVVLAESLAINLYLSRKAGGPVGTDDLAESARFAQWSFFAATEIEPHSIQILYNRVQLPADQRSEARVQEAVAALKRPLSILDAALEESGHPVGGRFTVADINLAETIRYSLPAPEALDGAPRVKQWIAACHARPAWKKIMALREAEPA
ncbi:glutathione S-transferase family protein [Falsiroseomonas sp. HW251]|uniref:glutathione S-transferase family protein n=1 Tax=Falsiroseomonas sp. HW251 TaxID=3390998 RepID=UPI003D320D7B